MKQQAQFSVGDIKEAGERVIEEFEDNFDGGDEYTDVFKFFLSSMTHLLENPDEDLVDAAEAGYGESLTEVLRWFSK